MDKTMRKTKRRPDPKLVERLEKLHPYALSIVGDEIERLEEKSRLEQQLGRDMDVTCH